MINLDDKKCKISHWVSLSFDRNTTAYFDSFGIEYIPQEVLNIIRDKSITLNIFIIQDNHSLRCGFYCVAFIEYKIARKILLDYLNLFSQNDYKKNEKKNNYFKDKYAKPQVYINNKTDEARNYVIEEIKHNDLMNERFKKTCKYLNYVEHLLILASTVTSCVSISAFSS